MGSLTADDAIKAHLDGKKTPYQLDLEVKDRKPSIIPKVGDRVKIKSLEWYEKWKDKDEDVNFPSLPNFFAKENPALPFPPYTSNTDGLGRCWVQYRQKAHGYGSWQCIESGISGSVICSRVWSASSD